jgi:DNA-binding response OmpR family regulator
VAVDGEEAVEIFNKHADEVDLVMLDLIMPRLGGREAGEQIRLVNGKVRILFASGYDPTSVGSEILDLEGVDLLMKPFGITELLGKVRELLDRN